MTPEFKAQYREGYGIRGAQRPNYTRCAENVWERGRGFNAAQCSRKNGHGPHGAWCKQHDRDAIKARDDARRAKWDADKAAAKIQRDLIAERLTIIQQIADGHNDARALCTDYLRRLAEAEHK